MLKRTRTQAEELVRSKFTCVAEHQLQILISRFEMSDDKYCANCSHLGVQFSIVSGIPRSRPCPCREIVERKELSNRLFARSNIPQLYRHSEVTDWTNMGRNDRELALNQASHHTVDAYSKSLPRMKRKGYGLFMCGPNGVGKTFLSCALGNAATRAGHSAKYYTMAAIVQMHIKGWYDDDANALVEGMHNADFLIIDDLDKIYRTKTGIETSLFDNLLRQRLQLGRPCIFTSNKTLASAQEDYGPSIHSMLTEKCAELVFAGADYRQKMAIDVRRDILGGN